MPDRRQGTDRRNPGGRPRKPIDLDLVDRLFRKGADAQEVADELEVHLRTLERRLAERRRQARPELAVQLLPPRRCSFPGCYSIQRAAGDRCTRGHLL